MNSDNIPVAHAFWETQSCCNNNPQNCGKLAHIKLKCLEEGLVSMRVRLVHVIQPFCWLSEILTCCTQLTVWVWDSLSLYMCTTYTAVREKNISQLHPSTKQRKKMILLHLTGASCNADDNKTAKLQRWAELPPVLYHFHCITSIVLLSFLHQPLPCSLLLSSLLREESPNLHKFWWAGCLAVCWC